MTFVEITFKKHFVTFFTAYLGLFAFGFVLAICFGFVNEYFVQYGVGDNESLKLSDHSLSVYLLVSIPILTVAPLMYALGNIMLLSLGQSCLFLFLDFCKVKYKVQ